MSETQSSPPSMELFVVLKHMKWTAVRHAYSLTVNVKCCGYGFWEVLVGKL